MIYVEIFIPTELEKVWNFTQSPEVHERWDLRFSRIEYLPKASEAAPQRFLYETRIGFGLSISGEGESVGTRINAGERTSALKFWSEDPRSLIKEGSGYWKYLAQDEGAVFLTGYDYRTRFGAFGKLFDRMVFRPLIGWATAWSFDSLRLWLVKGIEPELSLERTILFATSRLTLAFIWLYQGIFPKLLFPHDGELRIMEKTRLFIGYEGMVLSLIGVAEIIFGVLLILLWRSERLLKWQTIFLIALTIGAGISDTKLYIQPFNPITLNVAMIALAIIGLVVGKELPTARNCKREKE